MKTVVNSLKALYAKVGGTDDVSSISTTEDILGKIAEALGGDMPKGTLTVADAIDKVTEVATSGGGGGGGGSSDFSIANVKIDNQAMGGTVEILSVFEFERNELGEGSPDIAYPLYTIASSAEKTFKVIMYKGCASLMMDSTFDMHVLSEGNVQQSDLSFLVSGDATLTILDGGIS